MGIDTIRLEIEINKDDYFKTWEEAIRFANECRENGKHICIVERFYNTFYVTETPDWGSDTTIENGGALMYFN